MSGRQLHRLSALRIAKEVAPGHYADGGGLYMQIADSGARSWVFRIRLNGRVREMGLGPVSRVSLAEARKLATGYREMVMGQIDPILARREQQRRQLLDISADANVTFREAADAYIRAGTRVAKSQACQAVGQLAEDIRLPGDRRGPGA
jgi:Arm DNA-binding domain